MVRLALHVWRSESLSVLPFATDSFGRHVLALADPATPLTPATGRRLTTQYRMHPRIAEMPSSLFYDGALISAPSALALTPAPFPWPAPDTPVAFLPVDQARETADGLSQSNVAAVFELN